MPIKKSEKIWHNGKFINWDDAKLHVMSHVLHYGTSVFEGVRCYALPSGSGIIRAHEHGQRRLDSPKYTRFVSTDSRHAFYAAWLVLLQPNCVMLSTLSR